MRMRRVAISGEAGRCVPVHTAHQHNDSRFTDSKLARIERDDYCILRRSLPVTKHPMRAATAEGSASAVFQLRVMSKLTVASSS